MFPFVANSKHQFAFVVNVLRKFGIIKILVVFKYGGVRFKKDDRVFRDWIVKFFSVVNIVSTYGDDFHFFTEWVKNKFMKSRAVKQEWLFEGSLGVEEIVR